MPIDWAQGALDRLPDGVEAHEILQVLSGERPRFPVPAESHGIRLLTVWGRTRAGRALVVVLRPRNGIDHQIVTARGLTATEEEVLRTWEHSGA